VGFFTAKQKRLARNCSFKELENGYRDSESALRMAAYKGDQKMLKQAMKVHGNYEYALLYKNTPEYNKRRK
jgi:hypothetical protein